MGGVEYFLKRLYIAAVAGSCSYGRRYGRRYNRRRGHVTHVTRERFK